MARGERPIKLGDSWFSAKTIEVVRRMIAVGGRALNGLGGAILTKPNQTPNTNKHSPADTQWELSSIVERETALTVR